MLKKVIPYIDFDDQERVETFYFNMSEAELMEMELGTTGGMTTWLQRIIDEKDTAKLVVIFKDMILRSYGEKSMDGKRFEKIRDGKRLADDFSQTPAYSKLFMELATDDKAAAAFINGIIPQTVAAKMAEANRQKGLAAVTN